jgi:fatty acid desaturase
MSTMPSQIEFPSKVSEEGDRTLIKDLFRPEAKIFWLDLLLSALLGWATFIGACIVKPFTLQMIGMGVISAVFLYRSLAFIHELAHLSSNALPGFQQVWDLLVGIPMLFPSFIYGGVHADHHRPLTYGTNQDPEYLPFAGAHWIIVGFLFAQAFIVPSLLLFRFLILSPLGLLYPPLHSFLEKYASSLCMNLTYCRRVSEADRTNIKRTEIFILLAWFIPLFLIIKGIIPWQSLAIWYVITGLMCLVNALRALGAHRYRNQFGSMNRIEQLLDSIDTPGAFWTELWAPVGLRYHALHHYYPSLPYHNLGIAHRRFMEILPDSSPYKQTISPSLWQSLKTLWCDRTTAV